MEDPNSPEPVAENPAETPETAPPEPAPASPAPPPAAAAVINGRTEREIDLERQLETERQARKQREIRLSELEDENRQLKQVTPRPTSQARTAKKDSWTFFEDEEEQ